MQRLRVTSFFAALVLLSCSDPGYTLTVDLRTDLVPGLEFTGVRTRVGGSTRDRHAGRLENFAEGVRIAEIEGLESGTQTVEVELLDLDGFVAVSRTVRVELFASRGITVVVTRSCAAITCPPTESPDLTTCVAGECVDPRCQGGGAFCPDPECTADRDCPVPASCARASCDEGTCLAIGNDAVCGEGSYCDPEAGCRTLPNADAGVVDSGAMDTGPVDAGEDSGGDASDAGPRALAITINPTVPDTQRIYVPFSGDATCGAIPPIRESLEINFATNHGGPLAGDYVFCATSTMGFTTMRCFSLSNTSGGISVDFGDPTDTLTITSHDPASVSGTVRTTGVGNYDFDATFCP